MNVPEALTLEAAESAPELLQLLPDDVPPEEAIRAAAVSLVAELFRQVQDQGDRKAVVLAGECHERPARLWLHVRRVDQREAAGREAPRRDEVQDLERVLGRLLRVLVVGHEPTAHVR